MFARRLALILTTTACLAALPAAAQAYTAANNIASAPALNGFGPYTVAYDTDGATLESGEPTHVNSDFANSVWIKWTPTVTMHMRLDNHTSGSTGTKVRIYEKGSGPTTSVTNLKSLELGSDALPWNQYEGGIQVLNAVAGKTYFIVVVRSKYMPASDPGGSLKIEQSSAKPSVTFPGAPTATGKVAKIPFNSLGAVQFACAIDGAPVSCYSSGESGFFQKGFTGEGTHKLTVHSWNGFYNQGSDYTWTFSADGAGPGTTIDSDAPVVAGQGYPIVKFHASETEGVTFTCAYDQKAPIACTSPWMVSEVPGYGTHHFTVVAKDKWGNAGAPQVQTFDLQKPTDEVAVETAVAKPPVAQPVAPYVPPQQPPYVAPVTPQAQPEQPCAPKITHGRLTKKGMKVFVTGDAHRTCTVVAELRVKNRVFGRALRAVTAGEHITMVVKPRIKPRKGAKLRLVTVAR